MPPLIRFRGPLIWAASGGALGALTRLAPAEPAMRACAALVIVLAAGLCAGATMDVVPGGWGKHARRAGLLGLSVFLGGVAALLAAGGPLSGLGSAVVPAAAAVLSHGAAGVLRGAGLGAGGAVFVGAAVPAVLAGALFVADPVIEWNGSTGGSHAVARRVLVLNPITALTSGLGVDWQRRGWLYDGPAPGEPGLSYVGQYYPVGDPPSPWAWSLVVAVAGLGLLAGFRSSVE